MIERWTGEYANQSVSFVSYNSSDMVNKLSNGCVAIIHGTSSNVSSGGTHYMAILDISEDKSKVYVSNPWNGSNYQGWLSVSTVDSDFGSDSIAYITNDGSSVNYGAGGNSSGSSANSNINMSQNITDNNRGGYKINVNWNEETQKMIKKLKEKDFDLNKYLLASNDNEHLRNLLKSAIVTQYPDLRSANEIASKARIDANETQGCIKIKRYADNETKSFTNSMTNPTDSEDGGMYMTYMPYDDFSDLIRDNNESALNYFSMDRNNNLVIAGWETLDVQVSIEQTGGESDPNPDSAPEPRNQPYRKLTTKNVPYLDQVSNYAMPFSLLWTLLTYSDDEDFVNDVAKLVINTDIVIGIYDATSVKVTVYTNTYDKHVTTIDSVYVNGRKTGEVTVDHVYTYKVTEKQTLKTDNPSLKVKYADTWAAVYKNDYQVSRRTGDPTNDSINLDDETVDVNYGQANDENEINGRLDGNDSANQQVIDEKNRLKQETHQYNQNNFSYRYPILENAIDNIYNFSGGYVSVLKEEDIQNYIINMIIDEHSDGYIEDQFSNNEIIKEYIDNANVSRSDVISAVKELVRGARDDITLNSSGENLWDQLTKNSQDTRKNQTYQAEITSIQYEDSETHRNQTESIETTETTARVQDVTNRNDKVRFKKDPNANENGFVKLLYFSRKAKGNLNFIDTWFFESVDDTTAIADLKDLLKYLFQCAFGRDYGIDAEGVEGLKDIFDPDKMNSVSIRNTSHGTIVGGASYSSLSLSDSDMEIIYKIIECEDGGGSDENQKHHVCVIYNRLLSSAFSDNVEDFVDGGQFEVCQPGGPYWSCTPSQKTIDNCNAALQEGDSTGGAIGFVNVWLWDSYGGEGNTSLTWEPSRELFREYEVGGGDAVYFTTDTIRSELTQYSN